MAIKMTLKQAEQRRQELVGKIASLRQRGSDSDILEARNLEKGELAQLIGSVEYEPKRDANGRIIKKPHVIERGAWKGRTVMAIEYDTNKIKNRTLGLIDILSAEAQRREVNPDLGRRFSEKTFDNFDYRLNKKAYEDAKTYADMPDLFNTSRNSRIIIGGVGTGKTHLASAIMDRFWQREIPVMFATWETHLQRLRDEIDNTSCKSYLENMKSVKVLVIDDIGREKRTEWTVSMLYSVINYRYEHMLPTIITTNLTSDDPEVADSAFFNWVGNDVSSRLWEMASSIRTHGEDYREITRSKDGN